MRHLRWLAFAAALFGTSRAVAQDAKAHGRTSSLSWVRLEGAESCVATQKLAQAVEERLGRRVFVSASEADVSVEGHVARTPRGFRASLAVRDAKGALLGTRDVDSPERSCDALTEAVVFAVAVMIDPDGTGPHAQDPAPEPPPPPPAPLPAPAPVVVILREQPVPRPPPERHPWGIEVEGSFAVALGLVPGAGAGARLSAVVTPPHFWGIRVGGTYVFDSTIGVPGGARAVVSAAYGELAVCPLVQGVKRWRVLACAGAQVGALQSRGSGFPENTPADTVQVNVAVEGAVSFTVIGPLAAFAGATVLVPTRQDALTYTRAGGSTQEVFRSSAVAGIGEVGLAVHFP